MMPSGSAPQYETVAPTLPRKSISNQVDGNVAMKNTTMSISSPRITNDLLRGIAGRPYSLSGVGARTHRCHPTRRHRAVDALQEVRERVPGPDLDERATAALVDHRADRLGPAHGCCQLLGEEI